MPDKQKKSKFAEFYPSCSLYYRPYYSYISVAKLDALVCLVK